MTKLKLFIILLCSLWMGGAVGAIKIDAFSWYFGPNGMVINSSAASVSLAGPFCWDGSACGVAVGIQVTPPSGASNNVFLIQSQGTPATFTSDTAVSVINGLSGKTISGTASLNTPGSTVKACLYQYKKTSNTDGYSIIASGVCGGGFIPPIPVPTNCDLSMDNSVIDFGDISSAAFFNAGAGGKPSGTEVQQRTLNVSCSSPQASLAYLRMTTDSASGNMLVSSNKDVGFLMSAGENDPTVKPLTPNLSSSSYPLTLDSTGKATVTIKAVPVSVTGKKPVAGTFTSHALLDISWD